MKPQDNYSLKKLLDETGVSQSFFCKKLGVSKQAVSQVVNGRDKSKRIEKAIREHCLKLYL